MDMVQKKEATLATI